MLRPSCRLASAGLALATLLSAQHPIAPLPAALPIPANHLVIDTPREGEIWAGTTAWKVGLDRHGATFVPCLGSDEPSRPTRFQLQRAVCGGSEFALPAALPRHTGHRVLYARGDVVERFDLRGEGVEHSFVFETLPNRGDLVLDVAVHTTLEHVATNAGHTFVGPAGGVRYGHALALDAAGRTLPLATTWSGTALRIEVPAAFLATATLPLCVDPLIAPVTTVAATQSNVVLTATDIAHDASLGRWFVTYERHFSATDHDVYVSCLDSAMTPISLLTIDFTADYWSLPRVATVEASDIGCVVAETSADNAGPFAIGIRRFVGGPTATAFATQDIAPLFNLDLRAPDIGGDAHAGPGGDFLIVHAGENSATQEGFVVSTLLTPAGLFFSPQEFQVGVGYEKAPSVSKTCGAAGTPAAGWSVVFRQVQLGQSVGRLLHGFVHRSGVARSTPAMGVQLGPITSNLGQGHDVSSPATIDGNAAYLVVESRFDPIVGRSALVGHAVDYQGTATVTNATLANSSIDRRLPAVDSDGARFAVASTNSYQGGDADVRVATFGLVGNQLVGQDLAVVSLNGDVDTWPAIAAQGGSLNYYGLAWLHGVGGTWSLQASRYRGVGAGGFATRPTGCGNLAITPIGSPALGNYVQLALANVTGVPGFLVGAPVNLTLPGCAGCVVGASEQILLGDFLGLSIPADASLVGQTFAMQGLQLLAGAAPCLGQFMLSHTVDMTIQ